LGKGWSHHSIWFDILVFRYIGFQRTLQYNNRLFIIITINNITDISQSTKTDPGKAQVPEKVNVIPLVCEEEPTSNNNSLSWNVEVTAPFLEDTPVYVHFGSQKGSRHTVATCVK